MISSNDSKLFNSCPKHIQSMDLGFQTKASMKEENMPKKLAAVPRNEVGLVVVENELPYKKV